jgi:hypothetical protein
MTTAQQTAFQKGYRTAMEDIRTIILNHLGHEGMVTTIHDEREALADVREFVETGLGIH